MMMKTSSDSNGKRFTPKSLQNKNLADISLKPISKYRPNIVLYRREYRLRYLTPIFSLSPTSEIPTVHFRGYPGNVLIPCDGEESVKWSYINALKEAAYIIHGSSKNVMNMSHPDQVELWRSVMNGKLEAYNRISCKLKLGIVSDEFSGKPNPSPLKPQHSLNETEATPALKASRVPVRLYLWTVDQDFDDLEAAPHFDNWDQISYINRPVEINGEEKHFTLLDAVKSILPEFYPNSSNKIRSELEEEPGDEVKEEIVESQCLSGQPVIKLLRIQGIEPKMEIPFSWVVNNLMNPDYFIHMCLYIRTPKPNDT